MTIINVKTWIKGAPIIGKDKEEDVIKFIDKFITCRIPNPITEPRLYELVLKYEKHQCSDSCIRKRYTGHATISFCRYGYPKKVQMETTLNTVEDTLRNRSKIFK